MLRTVSQMHLSSGTSISRSCRLCCLLCVAQTPHGHFSAPGVSCGQESWVFWEGGQAVASSVVILLPSACYFAPSPHGAAFPTASQRSSGTSHIPAQTQMGKTEMGSRLDPTAGSHLFLDEAAQPQPLATLVCRTESL